MIDRAEIYVKGGDGGNGVISFRREKYVPFGGPNGGDGGDGGSVYLVGDSSLATLQAFRYKKQFKAKRGAHGKGKDMIGRRGDDLLVTVPLGTLVRRKLEDGSTTLVADIVEHGQRVRVAQGGKGGFGNAHFVTPTNQAPRRAEGGKTGEEAWLLLDLKLLADVGIVGYPNAGKSTLLSRVSHARPKIADYPFTTTEPVLGVVVMGYRSFVLADIPGIIEGAHLGHGLGLDFLRHIERTRVLIQLADGCSETLLTDLEKVEEELELYQAGLEDRPRIVAVNKIDLPDVKARVPQLREDLKRLGAPVYFISAATGEGVEELMKRALELLSRADSAPAKEKVEEEFKVFRPRPLSQRKSAPRGGRNG
ncbi:MAG TPA: GTPase ObgE [Dehalococcoidia bacterium]|nr:GTPase ObgE [Dehalococcoidia bacterium]